MPASVIAAAAGEPEEGIGLTDATPSGVYEERPKTSWFLWIAGAFFFILLMAVMELENTPTKWAWLGIASLNIIANGIQIANTARTRYVLWRRGLSIYVGKSREALIRFDKALMFRAYKSTKDAQPDMRDFGVAGPLRSYPTFGGRRRWLVIYERDDGVVQALVFDPSPSLERMFRQQLIKAEDASTEPKEQLSAAQAEDEAWVEEETPPEEQPRER